MHLRLFLFLLLALPLWCQGQPSEVLNGLLERAAQQFPELQAKGYLRQAASEGVRLARHDLMPSAQAAYQLNYATYNNITGMGTPLGWVPISGPPSDGNTFSGVAGSAMGVLATWEPFTFGQRATSIQVAGQTYAIAQASEQNALYLHQARLIGVYLDHLLSLAVQQVYEQDLARAEAHLKIAYTLAENGLRPGVDTALAASERARAKTDQLRGQHAIGQTLVQLSELVAEPIAPLPYDSLFFTRIPAQPGSTSGAHPSVLLQQQQAGLQELVKEQIRRSSLPKLGVWSTLYARGSGIDHTGVVEPADGLRFSRFNYGLGLHLSVPLLNFSERQIQLRQQEAVAKAAGQQVALTEWQLGKASEQAALLMAHTKEVVAQARQRVESAAFAYNAMLSRYRTGLVDYYDLMQAQYLLVKAQTELRRSTCDTWKALLYQASVSGDLNLFLGQLTP